MMGHYGRLCRARGVSVVVLAALSLSAGAVRAEDAPSSDLGWSAEISLGGSFATGNTDRQALDLQTKVQHRTENREDRMKFMGDFAREKKTTTANRLQVSAQTNYDVAKDKLYVLAFAQFDRDRFSGFRYEAEAGPGLGYRVYDTDELALSVELSSGYRHSEVRLAGGSDNNVFVRASGRFEYKLSDNAKLANELFVSGDSDRTKIENTFSVTSTLVRNLAARISFNARHNTNPPSIGIKKTDTLSKVSLVYAFE